MPRSLALLLIGLLLGGGVGFFLAAANNVALDGHHHPEADRAGHGRTIDLPAGPGAPTLDFRVAKDPASGWNLHVVTTGFRFAPESVDQPHRPGDGHAHVYVDGKKLARIYGPRFHLGALPPGEVTLSVTLNANDHSALAIAGRPLKAEKTITVE